MMTVLYVYKACYMILKFFSKVCGAENWFLCFLYRLKLRQVTRIKRGRNTVDETFCALVRNNLNIPDTICKSFL